ncbi:MAG: SGNH/GDSL hydrolase family protein, partial [Chitinophagaceae bacterium]|nr:SGNH/GDSL hydrolase family protein [Chitinophagaceae bacterium]
INQQLNIDNSINPKLDSAVIHTRNSIGFRGPELSLRSPSSLSIITMGGSTTACHFLGDDKTWPFLLGEYLKAHGKDVWLNNAGLDGHSTFGHEILLNDHVKQLHPNLVVFLTGINDIESNQPSFHDKLNTKGAYPDFKHFIFENSEVLNLALNAVRGWRAQKLVNTGNKMIDLKGSESRVVPDAIMKERLRQQEQYLLPYRKRLLGLIDTCIANSTIPVMMTQPFLFGTAVDSATGINFSTFPLGDNSNGQLEWQVLERYNDIVRSLCKEKNVCLVDLANLLPKNSLYFYDNVHYTNAGAVKIAEIVSESLNKVIAEKFSVFIK